MYILHTTRTFMLIKISVNDNDLHKLSITHRCVLNDAQINYKNIKKQITIIRILTPR